MKQEDKVRIAIIIPGGIGTGHDSMGVPVLERIVKLMANNFAITVFQLFPANVQYKVSGFELIGVFSPFRILTAIKLFFAFRQLHRMRKFTIVHGFWIRPSGFFAVLIGRVFKIKSIVSVLGGDAISLPDIGYGQLQHPLYKKISFWTLKHADEVTVLTQYLIENLNAAGFYRDNIRIIPWGIDTRLFGYTEKLASTTIQFLHIGNLHPVKDQETLLRAFAILCRAIECKLTLIGQGPSEMKLRLLIEQLGIKDSVTLLKPMRYEDLPSEYKKADVLLHTSISEGQCEVVTEAMSSGVLVCGTRVGLLFDIPQCCVAVDVGDYKALAEEVLKLLNAPQRLSMIRERARAWTNIHTIHWTVAELKKLYISSQHDLG